MVAEQRSRGVGRAWRVMGAFGYRGPIQRDRVSVASRVVCSMANALAILMRSAWRVGIDQASNECVRQRTDSCPEPAQSASRDSVAIGVTVVSRMAPQVVVGALLFAPRVSFDKDQGVRCGPHLASTAINSQST